MRLVVVGRRADAVRAALRRAGRVAVVAPSLGLSLRRDARVAHVAADPGSTDGESLARDVRRSLDSEDVAAVMASTEGTVLPAARLRAALGVSGMDTDGALACTDKVVMKERVGAAGIPHAPFLAGGADVGRERVVAELGLPAVLKARVGSGGRGTVVAREASAIPDPLPAGRLAEGLVKGAELSVESLVVGRRVLWSNLTEYVEPRAVNQLPYLPPPALAAQVCDLARRAITVLGIERGLCHLEVFATADGVTFGEIAARPPGGYIMQLISLAYGFSAWDAWVAAELGERPRVPAEAERHAAARVLHPGPGEVIEASGLEEARMEPGVRTATLRVRSGDVVTERVGAGQEVGHVIAVGADRETALERLDAGCRRIRLRLRSVGP